ncbi:MAG: UDP-N-acetylglucosamine 2-epimerase, partial [Gammaproteobacteria bacterium]
FKLIEQDGFFISAKIESAGNGTSNQEVVSAMAEELSQYARLLPEIKPDVCIVLGDRYEVVTFALSCHILRIPLAHIHGGELSLGSFDDANRHAITKLAYLHFPSTEEYRNRIIQMGEYPDRVFNAGALAVENINKAPTLSIKEISKKLNIKLRDNYFLVTLHPETDQSINDVMNASFLAEALENFPDYDVIWTLSNADPNGHLINQFLVKNKSLHIIENLGELYLPVMRKAVAVIGNSSSGIIEAPIVGVPTVNIGNRQDGRIRCSKVVDCPFEKKSIIDKINSILNADISEVTHPYGNGKTSASILAQLLNKRLSGVKRFFDFQ